MSESCININRWINSCQKRINQARSNNTVILVKYSNATVSTWTFTKLVLFILDYATCPHHQYTTNNNRYNGNCGSTDSDFQTQKGGRGVVDGNTTNKNYCAWLVEGGRGGGTGGESGDAEVTRGTEVSRVSICVKCSIPSIGVGTTGNSSTLSIGSIKPPWSFADVNNEGWLLNLLHVSSTLLRSIRPRSTETPRDEDERAAISCIWESLERFPMSDASTLLERVNNTREGMIGESGDGCGDCVIRDCCENCGSELVVASCWVCSCSWIDWTSESIKSDLGRNPGVKRLTSVTSAEIRSSPRNEVAAEKTKSTAKTKISKKVDPEIKLTRNVIVLVRHGGSRMQCNPILIPTLRQKYKTATHERMVRETIPIKNLHRHFIRNFGNKSTPSVFHHVSRFKRIVRAQESWKIKLTCSPFHSKWATAIDGLFVISSFAFQLSRCNKDRCG